MNYPQEITALENVASINFQDESSITAAELRQVISGFTTFLKKISPLATGSFNVGDVTGSDVMRTVSLPYDVGTSEYRVEGHFLSKSANFNKDNDVIWSIKDPTSASYKLLLREVSGETQNIVFVWAIYPLNL